MGNDGEPARNQDEPVRPQLGDRVRIVCGQLAGLVGVVERITPAGSYGLIVEQLSEGVYVLVSETMIERCAAK
jgi:hypothetical protein